MTDNGGEQPGHRSSGGDADSWFKPSENRFRTQSEYQDPMEGREESESEASEETPAVFPDSGGYAGLSASRPALVEPYPDALGVPPTPATPPAPPTPATDPQGPLGLSYPGASTDAYRPISRIPGGGSSSWEKPAEAPPVAPEWGASPETAPAWEQPKEPHEPAEPLWDRPTEPEPEAESEQTAEQVFASEPASGTETGFGWGSGEPSSWEPEVGEDAPAPTGGYPGIAASAQVPLPPEDSEGTDPVPAHDSWAARGHDSWATEPPDQEVPRRPESDSWTDPQAWDGAPTPTGGGFDDKDVEPWAEPDGTRWTDPSPSYLDDRYEDELSSGSKEWSTEPYDELSDPSPASPAQDFPSSVPMDDGVLGGGSGNTWAFDRNDPRLPDVVRDAELRRRESTPSEAERDGGPDTGELSAAVATSDDPLAAIANMQSRAKAKETEDRQEGSYPDADPFRPNEPHAPQMPEEPSWSRGVEGMTQMFDTSSFRDGPAGYGSDEYATASRDELGYDGRGLDGYGHDEPGADDHDPEFGDQADQGYDELGYDGRDYDEPGHVGRDYDEPGQADREYDELGYVGQGYDVPGHVGRDYNDSVRTEQGYDDQGYEEPGHGGRGLEPEGPDDRSAVGAAAVGLPSDLGPEPAYGRQPFEAWPDDRRDSPETDPTEDADDPEYDDGFTPADYGMSERPRQAKRRRDRISEDFPGFDDRPLGGEAGDAYPGYDSIDFLADTEPGAVQTLWLGVASLIPILGVITALVALFVTGPKAKKAIRESRGTLDGLGLITTGTVFAVIGIVVTVISIAVWLVL